MSIIDPPALGDDVLLAEGGIKSVPVRQLDTVYELLMVLHLWCEYNHEGSDIKYIIQSGCHSLAASLYRWVLGTNSHMCISTLIVLALFIGYITDVLVCVLLHMGMKALSTKRQSGLSRCLGTGMLKTHWSVLLGVSTGVYAGFVRTHLVSCECPS